jgi:hypothetical protein
MKRTIALLVSTAWLVGSAGFAVAQSGTTPSTEEKPATRALSPDHKHAACLSKAGASSKKRQKCDDMYTAAKVQEAKNAERAQTNTDKRTLREDRKRLRQ